MPITKINDSELFAQNRYHVNQGDVPGKTAAQMKEFMDYIPREVLIPKINELADSANAAAPADSVYTKSELDSKLGLKADSSGVYLKTQTYNKSEADGIIALKADASSVYTKTETDSLLSEKADTEYSYSKAQTYSKAETDSKLSEKAGVDSDKVIADVESQPQTENTAFLCREGGDIKLYKNGYSTPIKDGDAARESLSPMRCIYSTEEELTAAIEAHGLSSTTQSGKAAIRLFDLYTQDGAFVDRIYVMNFRNALCVRNQDANVTASLWSLAQWVEGRADIYGYFSEQGYSNMVFRNVTEFAKNVIRVKEDIFSKLASEEYVKDKLSVLQNSIDQLEAQVSQLSAGV